jgi:hypothetical protein
VSPETATVEVLAAEVRILQVGRRQVTLSVFKQLDVCVPNALVGGTFGRVSHQDDDFHHRDIDDDGTWQGTLRCYGACRLRGEWQTWVVGRHRDTGALVRCWDWRGQDPEWEQLPLIVLAGLR